MGKPYGLPVTFETIGVAVLAPTAFNPADRLNVTLSLANLKATGVTGLGGVRSLGTLGVQKYYFEYTYNTIFTNSIAAGIALASYNLANINIFGAAVPLRSTGNIMINNLTTGATLGIIPVGAVLGVAVDVPAALIWFRLAPAGSWNGSGTADPATGAGGLSISALVGSLYGLFETGSGDVGTANFGASGFTGGVPAGFTSGFIV